MSGNNGIETQAKVISRVHQQLATDFHPVLKNVAAAASNFSKTLEANQKAFSDYVMSLNQLVSSAKSAEPDTQQVVDELKAIIKKLRKIGEETSKVIIDFKDIAERVQGNAEAEKENHRKTLNKYLKEQRQIHKDVDKKRKSNKDLQGFYNEKCSEAIRLQYLRYKYFSEKHSKLLGRFTESWKEIATEFPQLTVETAEVVENESQKSESKHTNVASRPPSEKPESRDVIPSQFSPRGEFIKTTETVDVAVLPSNELISPTSQLDDTIGRFFHEYNREEIDTFPKDKSDRSSVRTPYSGQRHNPLENYSSRPNLQQIYIPVFPSVQNEPTQQLHHTQPMQPQKPAEPIQPIQHIQPVQNTAPVKPIQPPSKEEPVHPLPKPRQTIHEAPVGDSLLIPATTTYAPIFNERYSGLNHIDQSSKAPVPRHQITVPPATPPPAPPRKGNIRS